MFASDDEIERRYRNKASAYASGVINGGGIGAIMMLLMLALFFFYTTFEVTQCEGNGGMLTKTLQGNEVCVVKAD